MWYRFLVKHFDEPLVRRIEVRFYIFVLLAVLHSILGFTTATCANEPKTIYWEGSQLAELRSSSITPSKHHRRALSRLKNNAEEALGRGPNSVTFKNETPPSGDKHDYMSFSRYWWPNPDTEDGLPYIRKDGQVNVELRRRGDRDQIGLLVEDVETLALAAYLLDEQKYANHAADNLRAWFLDSETKMNPHLSFGQSVPGRAEGRGVGIIDTRGFIRILDAVELLSSIETLQEDDLDGLKKWFAAYLDWLLNSELGKDEAARDNNHGSWYAAQVARIAVFVDQVQVARRIAEEVLQERIPAQFSSDGSQPAELTRTQSLHYSLFNLEALSVVARVGQHLEIDLWKPSGGGGLQPGIDFLIPYLTKEKKWSHPQINAFALSRGACSLLRMASTRYSSTEYLRPLTTRQIKYRERDYSSLVFRAKRSDLPSSSDPVVTVDKESAPNPPKYEIPDISSFTVEAVRALVPAERNGKAEICLSKDEHVLNESFRRDRGKDLQKRQGTAETRVIKLRGGTLSLQELAAQINDEEIIHVNKRVATLRLPILVGNDAALVIDGKETPEVRLSTSRGSFIANAGELYVVDAKVTSWEETTESPTLFTSKYEFRPFISSYIRSETYLANSRFFHLGFHAPTAYGISLSSEPEREDPSKAKDWPTGQLVGNEFHGLYYGFYSYEARSVKIIDNKYNDCVLYGIDPHDRSIDLIIARNSAVGTRERHGIIGSRGISNSFIFDNVAHSNQGSGIMLDRECSGNVISGNKVYKNGQGIAIYESCSNIVADNMVVQNAKSGIRVRNSVDIDVFGNDVVANGDYGLEASSKRLSDHDKRAQRGDTYTKEVALRVYRNVVAGNRGGLMKGNSVNRLILSNISRQTNLSELESATGLDEIELYPSSDTYFGSELKKNAADLERVFGDDVKTVEYRKPVSQ